MTASKTQKFRNRKRGVSNAPPNTPAPLSRKEKNGSQAAGKAKKSKNWSVHGRSPLSSEY